MIYHGTTYLHIFQRYQRPTHFLVYSPPRIDGATVVPSTGLGLAKLDSTVQLYYQYGLADSTHRTYTSGIRRFYQYVLHKVLCLQSLPGHGEVAMLLCSKVSGAELNNTDSEDVFGCS